MSRRPPIPPEHRVIVLVFRFDTRNATEKALARYLARAPRGKMRSRARDLILAGFRLHLEGQGASPSTELTARPRRASIEIDGIYFDAHDPFQVQCAGYLKRAQYGDRREKSIRLLISGFKQLQAAAPQSPQKGTDQ